MCFLENDEENDFYFVRVILSNAFRVKGHACCYGYPAATPRMITYRTGGFFLGLRIREGIL